MKRLLLLSMLFTLGCSRNQEGVASKDAEDFTVFLRKFSEDSLFQVKSVQFPFTIITWEIGTNGEDISARQFIEKGDWTLLDFTHDEEHENREIDAFTEEINLSSDTAVLELRGIDNGIHIDYTFKKTKDGWVLLSMTDRSN